MSDSLDLSARLSGGTAPSCCYRGVLRPAAVQVRLAVRSALERGRFRIALAKIIEEQDGTPPGEDREDAEILPETGPRLAAERREDPDMRDGFSYQLFLDGKPVAPPESVESVMESIIQDHGEIPPDYLVAAGPGLYRHGAYREGRDPDSVWSGTYHEEGAYLYDEWDFSREHHRKGRTEAAGVGLKAFTALWVKHQVAVSPWKSFAPRTHLRFQCSFLGESVAPLPGPDSSIVESLIPQSSSPSSSIVV